MRADIPFLVLDLGFDVIDGVGGFDLQGDGLSGEGLDEDLHAIRRGTRVNLRSSRASRRGRTLDGE